MNKQLCTAFEILTTEAKDLYLGTKISEILDFPSSLEFSRDYVGKNLPVVIRNCILDWPAVIKWNSKYFRNVIPDKKVTVAVTPNGFADAIAKDENGKTYFVMPEETELLMSEFLDKLNEKSGPVYYIQKQNSNMITDFNELYNDINVESLKFAKEVFNKEPDAINFWMGDSRAITSMHKDPYENMYCVISGYKDFILISPLYLANVPREKYNSAVYKTNESGKMYIDPLLSNKKPFVTEWVSIDPLQPDIKKYPNYQQTTVYEVRVNSGDILYLPSLWYHHVRQSHKCIAVNFWFDMDYDSKYCYYKMMEYLCGYGH